VDHVSLLRFAGGLEVGVQRLDLCLPAGQLRFAVVLAEAVVQGLGEGVGVDVAQHRDADAARPTSARSYAFGASTPWKRIRCSRGRGTSAARRCT